MPQEKIVKFFSNCDLNKIKGLLITTARNVSDDNLFYKEKLNIINNPNKVFLVEHEVKPPINKGFWNDEIITLAPIDYKNQTSCFVNPNYFGNIKKHKRNKITRFFMVGPVNTKRRNINALYEAVRNLKQEGIDFKITIIAQKDISDIPYDIRNYFEAKGYPTPFDKMYSCLEKSDYILALLDKHNESHYRYITTGTSGTYQLSYGFLKPCIIEETFCKNRFLNNQNAILYSDNNLTLGLKKAIGQNAIDYDNMVLNLEKTVLNIRKTSKNNLWKLINKRKI